MKTTAALSFLSSRLSPAFVLPVAIFAGFSSARLGAQVLFVAENTTIGRYNATTGAGSASFISGLTSAPAFMAVDSAGHLFVTFLNGTVGEYSATTGAVINRTFISGLGSLRGITLDGNGHLFVANFGGGTVGEYDAVTGAAINASLIPIGGVADIALSGNGSILVSNNSSVVGAYNPANGIPIQAASIAGQHFANDLATDDAGHLFVLNYNGPSSSNFVSEFDALTGATINSSLVSGLTNNPLGIAVDNAGHLFVANHGTGKVAMYDATTGALLNGAFITTTAGLPFGVTFSAIPEPSQTALMAGIGGLVGVAVWRKRRILRCS